jgi:chromosome segregation ATPase
MTSSWTVFYSETLEMNEQQVEQIKQSKTAKESTALKEQIAALQKELAQYQKGYKEYRNHYEVAATALKNTQAQFNSIKNSHDYLVSMLKALEWDSTLRVYILGEEAQDVIDNGRKVCGLK